MVDYMINETHVLPPVTILVVDDNRHEFNRVKALFQSEHPVLYTNNTVEAEALLSIETIGILVCNESLEGESGLQFMARINKAFPLLQPILMSEGIDANLMAIAINEAGVLKYLNKPFNETQLQEALTSALDHHQQASEMAELKNNYRKALQKMHGLPYFAKRARQTTRILLHNANDLTTAAGTTIAIMSGILFVLGIIVLMGLYVLKTIFDINLFTDIHFVDLIMN